MLSGALVWHNIAHIVNQGDSLQVWKVSADIWNTQPWTADKGLTASNCKKKFML
jgi:hypothetical protein